MKGVVSIMSTNTYIKTLIYKATNRINGFCYIGVTTQSLKARKSAHERDSRNGSNLLFHQALREVGGENFDWSILVTSDDLRESFAVLEKKYIQENRSYYKDCGYNMNKGGGGYSQSKIPISKEDLAELYVKKMTSEIAKIYSVGKGTIHRWLDKYGIEKKSTGGIAYDLPQKDKLENLYLKEGLSMKQISKIYGVNAMCVCRWIHTFDIPAHVNKTVDRPSKLDLKRLLQENLSYQKIAKIYGAGTSTVCRWVKYYELRKNKA
jgi:group I intron endonuclease